VGILISYIVAQAEERAEGRVASDVYRVYITSWGPWLMVPIAVIVFFICERSLTVRDGSTLVTASCTLSCIQRIWMTRGNVAAFGTVANITAVAETTASTSFSRYVHIHMLGFYGVAGGTPGWNADHHSQTIGQFGDTATIRLSGCLGCDAGPSDATNSERCIAATLPLPYSRIR